MFFARFRPILAKVKSGQQTLSLVLIGLFNHGKKDLKYE